MMEKEKEDKISVAESEGDRDAGGGDNGNEEGENENGDNGGDDDNVDINQANSDNFNLRHENGSSNTDGQKTKKKMTRAVKEILTNSNTKFMSNFDPELSNRERRKQTRKLHSEGKKNGSVNDENNPGSFEEKDVCDCLVEDCPGCHFPCPKCRSCKCGVECRVNRKWTYEAVENEADIRLSNNTDDPAN